jgi:hypothetical protein
MYRYTAFFQGKRYELQASTMHEAQSKAAQFFNVKQPWRVAVCLSENSTDATF